VAGNAHQTRSARVVGPVPEGVDPEAYERLRRRVLWSMPSGLYVLGSTAGGRRNLMTLNWATQVAVEPKMVAVGIEVGALTNRLVREGRCFALSILRRDDRATVRKFVKPLDDDGAEGSLAGFAVTAHATGAPVLVQAAAWIDCQVRHQLDLGSHTLFVGEVVDCGADPGQGPESSEGTGILRMEDTRMSYGG
jgi:flavin reductase (DIM6/NTAB) family NADH-FMN oxidoreductase RutF